jgi:hypothetical protein
MMQTKSDTLLIRVERLEQALTAEVAGRECGWTEAVRAALADIGGALRQHTFEAEAPDGLFAQVDLTRPTLVRQVGGLRHEHADLVEQAATLQQEVERAAEAFQARRQALPLAEPLPEPSPPRSVADFGVLRQRGEDLVAALQHHRERETGLLLESVETDIGVCD